MHFLYTIAIYIAGFLLKTVALFSDKIHLFVDGRKNVFTLLKNNIKPTDDLVWMHCASLGEFEQGRPIIEKIKSEFPGKKIVLTFFSPSGYEIRKNYNGAHIVCYLPLDTPKNATKFLQILQPNLAIFVKYEFWPNYLKQLKKQGVKTILVSGIFRKNQIFFKFYGKFMRRALNTFSHFFVQDNNSKILLEQIGFNNCSISGDTRFDRVYEITAQNNSLDFIEKFTQNATTLVAGSTWAQDEDLLVKYINAQNNLNHKFIIAPHNIQPTEIEKLKQSISKKVVLFSEMDKSKLSHAQVFIIDTIGLLTKIYSYGNLAYVGGGYTKSGVHNVLEPAAFSLPIVIGPNFSKFKEVNDLIYAEGCFSVNNSEKLSVLLDLFFNDVERREQAGEKAFNYIQNNIGATNKIINYLKNERKT
jgi:3-deoxy-D-manno-octulosonic-acid transferase